MKHALLLALLVVTVGTSSGCCLIDRLFFVRRCYPLGPQGTCGAVCSDCGVHADRCQCGYANGGLVGRHRAGAYADGAMAGNTHGHVAYPYYTNRGPRDFLADNPRGIGP